MFSITRNQGVADKKEKKMKKQNHNSILQRYARQMILPQIGLEGQKVVSGSKVLVIGAGGIGSTVLMYLASSGIPATVLDFDAVEISNLHRQIIHEDSMKGMNKAESAAKRMKSINPTLNYPTIMEKLTTQNASEIISQFDLVIDATDNFTARYIINDACCINNKPYISGSAVGMEGQITVIVPHSSACYRCLYPKESFAESCRSCANAGVLGPVPGLIGCLEAIEATKLLLIMHNDKKKETQQQQFYVKQHSDVTSNKTTDSNTKTTTTTTHTDDSTIAATGAVNDHVSDLECLIGRQTLYDGSTGSFHTFTLPGRDVNCIVCGENRTIITMADCEQNLNENNACNVAQMKQYKIELLPENNISATEYYETRICQELLSPHIILDVRSAVQFELSSFIYSGFLSVAGEVVYDGGNVAVYKSLESCLSALQEQQKAIITTVQSPIYLINVPLETLKGGKGTATKQAENRQKQLLKIAEIYKILSSRKNFSLTRTADGTLTIENILESASSAGKAVENSLDSGKTVENNLDIFVLCRRGIDSTVATKLLLDAITSGELVLSSSNITSSGSISTSCDSIAQNASISDVDASANSAIKIAVNDANAVDDVDVSTTVASKDVKVVGKGVYNMVGGLTAWKHEVEPSFPMY